MNPADEFKKVLEEIIEELDRPTFTNEELKKLWEVRNDYKAGKLSENIKPKNANRTKRKNSNRANKIGGKNGKNHKR